MIAKTIVHAMRYVDRVIVVDDGSVDDTGAIAKGLGALTYRHSRNLGKGQALRTIFRAARELRATVLVTLDADSQHHPADIPKVVAPILNKEADVAIGSRIEGDSTPALRRTGQKILDLTTAVHDHNGKIVDSQSGFRAYSEKAIRTLEFGESGMGVESESLRKAAQRELTIIQVPVAVSYGRETDHTLNPVLHFTDVVSAIAKQTFLKRPVRFLGVPAAVLVVGGLYWWLLILDIFNRTREFAIGNAIVASVVLMVGFFLGISTLILLAIVLMVQERR
jgi:glycosyltransferase involved in cell wall biosynthesis